MTTTTTYGLPLISAPLAAHPWHVPNMQGRPFKTEQALERTVALTRKRNWWHMPDDDRPEGPHSHPWMWLTADEAAKHPAVLALDVQIAANGPHRTDDGLDLYAVPPQDLADERSAMIRALTGIDIAPDLAGVAFVSDVVYGAITHTVYWVEAKWSGGDVIGCEVKQRTETWKAGQSYRVRHCEFHVVTAIEPGTMTEMTCGPGVPGAEWGYLDIATGDYTKAAKDEGFMARRNAINPPLLPAKG